MATKKKPANFPLFFYDDTREEAQRRADEDWRGNMTAYLNALVKADIRKHPKFSTLVRAFDLEGEGRTKKSKP